MSTTKTKGLLRHGMKEEMAGWTKKEKDLSDSKILESLLVHPWIEQKETFMLYWSVGQEIDTKRLLSQLLSRGKRVLLPRCLPNRQMEAREMTALDQLVMGAYQIAEPSIACPIVAKKEIDLILVPALCYDKKGYRLGHGGGYYDRYLMGYDGCTLGVCREVLLQKELPIEATDLPVKQVVTEKGVYRFDETHPTFLEYISKDFSSYVTKSKIEQL